MNDRNDVIISNGISDESSSKSWLLFILIMLFFCIFNIPGLTEHAPIECGATTECPHPCRCADGIVDCREKSLTTVPTALPEDTTEL